MLVVNGVEDLAIVQQRYETSFQLCFRVGIALPRKGRAGETLHIAAVLFQERQRALAQPQKGVSTNLFFQNRFGNRVFVVGPRSGTPRSTRSVAQCRGAPRNGKQRPAAANSAQQCARSVQGWP